MEKTKNSVKRMLKEQYEQACNGYLCELLRMWELSSCYGYWNSDEPGTIYHYAETHNLTMEDIIYIVENDIEEDEVLAWEDYCVDAYEFKFTTPNLRAWHKGCPRTPQSVFDKLRALKANLESSVEAEKQRIENESKRNPVLDMRIDACDLSVQTLNVCKYNNINTLGDLTKITRTEWLKFCFGGKKSLAELDDLLASHCLQWGDGKQSGHKL